MGERPIAQKLCNRVLVPNLRHFSNLRRFRKPSPRPRSSVKKGLTTFLEILKFRILGNELKHGHGHGHGLTTPKVRPCWADAKRSRRKINADSLSLKISRSCFSLLVISFVHIAIKHYY